VNKQEKPGYYAVKWDGKDDKSNKPASGIYFCRLETSKYKATKKIISLH
jgi:flagellar hook assembly protein FlgD